MTVSRIIPIHTGHYTMPSDTPFAGDRVVVTAFVIEHPRGVFLFDTGFSPEPKKMVDRYQPLEMRSIDEALDAAGHTRADVRVIANCHFHADHAGGNRHFPGVPIIVQRAEVAHARSDPEYTHLPHVLDFAGAKVEEIDGEAQPWPGIRVIPTPGHSPGHQSVVVETDEGRVILGGQAENVASDYAKHLYSHELATAGIAHGPYPAWVAAFAELDPVRVVFAHDRAVWRRDAEAAVR